LGAVLGAAAGVIITPGATRTMIGLREDGKFLYVLNSFTNDVTLVDVEKGASVGEIPVGRSPYDLEFLPEGAGMWILSTERMTRLEFATNAVTSVDLDTKDRVLGMPFLEPERDRILVPRPTGLDVLRFTTGEKVGWVGGLPHPVRIHLVPAAPAP
jgi:YVTN family beta-propeller protein